MSPCPFCGGAAKLQRGWPNRQKQSRKEAFIKCTKCGAKTKTIIQMPFESIMDVEKYAIQLWENRYDK